MINGVSGEWAELLWAHRWSLYTYDVEATDGDGDILTYSLTSNPGGMTIDSATGVITWTPTTFGDYNVGLEASDGDLS